MSKESGFSNKAEKQDQGAPSYAEAMDGVVVFDAAEAKKRAADRKREMEQREREMQAEAERQREKMAAENEARKAKERAEVEAKEREHQDAWEAHQEGRDYPTAIRDTFISNINESIMEATEDGKEFADFTKEVDIDYGQYDSLTRRSTASTLVGREFGSSLRRAVCDSAIDSIIEKDSGKEEFGDDIRDLGVEQMSQVKQQLEEAGYFVVTEAKTGIIKSVAWGEEAAKLANESKKSAQASTKQKTIISKLLALFGGEK